MDICVFSKHLQEYDIATLAEKIQSVGITSIDLTVRDGGHVEPSQAKEKLPEAIEILHAAGVNVAMVTTNITNIHEPYSRDILEAAAASGVKFYKLGYYRYFEFGSIHKLMAESQAQLADIAAANTELGLWGGYHNHSASFLGANPLHIHQMIEALDEDAIGCYWDVGHAVIEGLAGSWDAALDQLHKRIRMLAIKDLAVNLNNQDWRCDVVSLGQGCVPWSRMCSWLKQIEGQLGPVSIHGEYNKPADAVLKLMAEDRDYFIERWNLADKPLLSSAL